MSRNPFDEFRKIEKMFEKLLKTGDFMVGGTSRGISIQKMGDKTRVDVHGDISERELEKLRKKYPDAEITVDGRKIEDSNPVEVLDENEQERFEDDDLQNFHDTVVEEVDEEEIESEKLALKRFKEKQRERKEKDDD
ncbi:hypothetical protein AKJ56_00440 [candidate division MSBL1 archaeon SCGC-AAA382N08]|uniref:Uncharacterized protein n=1 Tax=candidate division MSBL1 archaeon SCGC-AAA382N08 TaxID=1698285 RepID=A0A133VQM1_9EURY|nr:hypothetical protein AKJ56_00440 [candidate division MSBL1 archaeon SCGC-AAA382N08]